MNLFAISVAYKRQWHIKLGIPPSQQADLVLALHLIKSEEDTVASRATVLRCQDPESVLDAHKVPSKHEEGSRPGFNKNDTLTLC